MACIFLAIASAGFAGHKIVALERMANPPADLGLNFSKLKPPLADAMPTGSIGRAKPTGLVESPLRRERVPQAVEFRLMSVVNGVAMVEVKGPGGRKVLPVAKGQSLPGAGEVLAISRQGNRWRIITRGLTIFGAPQ